MKLWVWDLLVAFIFAIVILTVTMLRYNSQIIRWFFSWATPH